MMVPQESLHMYKLFLALLKFQIFNVALKFQESFNFEFGQNFIFVPSMITAFCALIFCPKQHTYILSWLPLPAWRTSWAQLAL